MKRTLSIILLLCLAACISACGTKEEPVRFYYSRAELQYNSEDGVMAAESRDTLSRQDSLAYLLSFYLEGPISSELTLPVPAGTRILEIKRSDGDLTLVMSREFTGLEGMDLTVACSCISATCFDLTDAQQVTFTTLSANAASRTITRDALTLTDTVIAEVDTTTVTE